MKYTFTFLIVAVLFTSCEKITEFELEKNTEITLPATSPVSTPIESLSPEVTTNFESKFESNNTNKDNIESLMLKDMVLTIVSPESENFDFLESVEIYIKADGEPQKRIAYKNSVPTGVQELSLNTSDDDLKPYIIADTYQLKVKVVADETYANDITINAYTNFLVDAKIIS